MALSPSACCSALENCARKLLDTADIVRDGDLSSVKRIGLFTRFSGYRAHRMSKSLVFLTTRIRRGSRSHIVILRSFSGEN